MIVKVVNIHEAKTELSALIQLVLNGEKVIITNNNQPIVELKLYSQMAKKRIPGALKGKIAILEDLGKADKEVENLLNNSEIFPSGKV